MTTSQQPDPQDERDPSGEELDPQLDQDSADAEAAQPGTDPDWPQTARPAPSAPSTPSEDG